VYEAEPDSVARRTDDLQESLETRSAASRQFVTRLESLTGEACSPDGLVRAMVDQAGRLVDLKLDDRVRAWPVQRIAATVLATTGLACEEAAAQVREVLAELGLAAGA
jgi:hypothetical protein